MKIIEKIILYISIFCLLYFICLMFLFPLITGNVAVNIIRAAGELITIPLMLFPLFALVYAIIKLCKKERKPIFLWILFVNILTIIINIAGFIFIK